MSTEARKKLSLPGRNAGESEEREFELDFFDVLLPCRNFNLSYRFAEVGSVSLVTEFLLRLVHAATDITEEDAASFFGFNAQEMRVALEGVEAEGFVYRSNGSLSLTAAGRALFQLDQSTPQIYALQSRQSTFGFDLISLAPQENPQISEFERAFRELPIQDFGRVSKASHQIRDTFKKWFYELMQRAEKGSIRKASLYSIDDVSAGRRYAACVPVLLRATTARPSSPEVDLVGWRTAQEVEDRGEVVEAVSAYVENLNVPARKDDRDAYAILREIASEFLTEYARKDGAFSVERFLNETAKRAGELRSDRPTVPVVGTLFTPSNAERLRDALSYARKKDPAPSVPKQVTWLVPSVHWGQTRALRMALRDLAASPQRDGIEGDGPDVQTVALFAGSLPDHIAMAFDRVERAKDDSGTPPSLEILFVPGMLAAVLVHCPIQTQRGVPVPLGILSFDDLVIQRAHDFLAGHANDGVILGGTPLDEAQ